MWRKDEAKPQGVPAAPVSPVASFPQPAASSAPASSSAPTSPLPVSPRAAACIAQGIKIKGEITGKEDLLIDGTIEGKLELEKGMGAIGPN